MDLFLIIGFLYAVLILTDLIPTIRNKDKKELFFSIPIYCVTLTVNLLIAYGVNFPKLIIVIEQGISSIFKMQ